MVLDNLISIEFITEELFSIPLSFFITIFILHNSLSRKIIKINQNDIQHSVYFNCDRNHRVEICYSYMNSISTLYPNVENIPEFK